MTGSRCGTLLLLGGLLLPAQTLREYERKVTEFTLANGLHFILLERHQVPVVSFHTLVMAGSAQDPGGQTGLAHVLEHMAFKGTESIGTKGWTAEKKALDDLEDAYDRLVAERNKGRGTTVARVVALESEVKNDLAVAQGLEDPSEFERVLAENGATGVNCHTTPDSIETAYSLPSNRIELWFLMESQRLAHPVFRDFYGAREAVIQENKTNVESKLLPKMQQALLATAFAASPYRNPELGWPSDLATLRPAAAKAFYDTYFVPGGMVISIVGDVDPANARRLAERYFGSMLSRPLPDWARTEEPPQLGPKTALLAGASQPALMVGYKRPNQLDRDDLTLDVIRMILAEGRAGLLYKELVEGQGLAQTADATATIPAGRYRGLFVFTLVPAANHTLAELQKGLDDLLARFQSKPVDADTLARVKTTARGRVIRLLGNNRQLAALLPAYYANYGDWRKLFNTIGDMDRVTAEELQRASVQYFNPMNRTAVYVTNAVLSSVPAEVGGAQ